MNRRFGIGKEDLRYLSRIKRRVFYCIISLTVILNIFLSAALNLYKFSEENQSKAFFVMDLKNDLTLPQKEKLENMIWQIEGINEIQYLPKEKSFLSLQKELNISIPMKDNPLSDSMVIYLEKKSNVEKIHEILENYEEVKEVFQDVEYLKQLQKNNDMYRILMYVAGGSSILIFLLLIYLFKMASALDFFNCINVIREDEYNLVRSKRRNLIPFTLSTILGELIFFHIYLYVRKMFIGYHSDFLLMEYWNVLFCHGVILIVINLVVWILPITFSGIDGEEE